MRGVPSVVIAGLDLAWDTRVKPAYDDGNCRCTVPTTSRHTRHWVPPSAGPVTGSSGVSSTPRLHGSIVSVSGILDHPLSRMMTAVVYATAGTGSAVTDLIFSIAKREVTFFSGTALISFL